MKEFSTGFTVKFKGPDEPTPFLMRDMVVGSVARVVGDDGSWRGVTVLRHSPSKLGFIVLDSVTWNVTERDIERTVRPLLSGESVVLEMR